MPFFTILLISVSLAIDSFSASIACGSCIKKVIIEKHVRVPLFLSLFQTIAPLLGWFLGKNLEVYIKSYDHWVAFFLLLFIGNKMIYESINSGKGEKGMEILKLSNLFLISFATSIDAFIIGVSFAFLHINIFFTSLMIGIVTFLFSSTGILIGNKIKSVMCNKAGIFGGLILIFLGIKILFEHLTL